MAKNKIFKIIELFDKNQIFKGTILGLIFIGILAGFQQYYIYQMKFENPILWIFTADCPIAMCIFLLAYSKNFKNSFLNIFAFSSVFKYGLAGTFLFFFTIQKLPIVYIMFLSHIGMLLSTILLIRTPFDFNSALFSSAILLVNDFIDIKFKTLSYLFYWTTISINFALAILIILSISTPLIYLFLKEKLN